MGKLIVLGKTMHLESFNSYICRIGPDYHIILFLIRKGGGEVLKTKLLNNNVMIHKQRIVDATRYDMSAAI